MKPFNPSQADAEAHLQLCMRLAEHELLPGYSDRFLHEMLVGLEANPLDGPYTGAIRSQLHSRICRELDRRFGL